jgi:hypothetical protein
MKVCIFVLSIVLVIIGSQCFPDFLNAIFFLAAIISGASIFYDQRNKR